MFFVTKTNTAGVEVTFAVKEVLRLSGRRQQKQWQECIGLLLFLPGHLPLLSDITIFRFCFGSRDKKNGNYAIQASTEKRPPASCFYPVWMDTFSLYPETLWQWGHIILWSELAKGCRLWPFRLLQTTIFTNIPQPYWAELGWPCVEWNRPRLSKTEIWEWPDSIWVQLKWEEKPNELNPRSVLTPTSVDILDQCSANLTCSTLYTSLYSNSNTDRS